MKKIILSISLLWGLLATHAQKPVLLKDCNPSGDSNPYYADFTCLGNGKTIFAASDLTEGRELWITNGTTGGTSMLKDICPGSCSSYPNSMFYHNNKVFFSADNGVNGTELWVTDGTVAGTVMLKDINTTSGAGSYPIIFESLNGSLIFQANDGINGNELWITDGTATGTQLLKDINVGLTSSYFNIGTDGSYEFLNLNNRLFFTVDNGTLGVELWVTDGTTAGTLLLKDINPGAANSNPYDLTLFDSNRFVFSADDGTQGRELWVSDGTVLGTNMLADLNTAGSSNPSSFFVHSDVLYFSAFNGLDGVELFTSDGTAAGTGLYRDINASGDSYPKYFAAYKNKIFFTATSGTDREMYTIDPATNSVGLFKNINTAGSSDPYSYFVYSQTDKLYFLASAEDGLDKLFESDGTATNTLMLSPDIAGIANPFPTTVVQYRIEMIFTECSGQLFFPAAFSSTGTEPYVIGTNTTSIYETEDQNALLLFPNPVSGRSFIIYAKDEGEIEISDIQGKIVFKKSLYTSENNIDVGNLQSGIYLVKVGNSIQKLIKQ